MAVSTVPAGLSSAEAARRMSAFGPNAVAEELVHPLRRIARHFWAPVPWMLEATIALQFAIGERVEALMVAALLMLNVALGVFQEIAGRCRARTAKAAAGAEGARAPRWDVGGCAGRRSGARRHRAAFARQHRAGRSAHPHRLGAARPVDADRRVDARSKRRPARPPMPARWSAAARRSAKSLRPERAPISAAPPNWSASPMSKAANSAPCLVSCAI